jgi:hypothetical protein
MPSNYRPCVPEQDRRLAHSLRDWLRDDPLAYVVRDLVDQWDRSAFLETYNFTDPDSRIMQHKPDGFVQGDHVQVAVEGLLQLIVPPPRVKCPGEAASRP